MITISNEDFANLDPAERRQYRAAANFFRLAKTTTDPFKKRELLIEGRGHLQEVKDIERIKLVDVEIAFISEAITQSLTTSTSDSLQ